MAGVGAPGPVRGEPEQAEARDGDDRGADQRALAVPEGVQDDRQDERAEEPREVAAAPGGGGAVQRGGGDAGPGHVTGRLRNPRSSRTSNSRVAAMIVPITPPRNA